jgi:competence protein ComEC
MSLLLPLLIVCFIGTTLSEIFWPPLQWLLQGLHSAMRWAAAPDWSYMTVAEVTDWAIVLLVIGSLWWLAPAWVIGRPLGLLLLLAVPWITPAPPAAGMVMHVFDVGQGSAVLLQSRQRNGLYDTGPRFGRYTVMQGQILPALHRMAVDTLDYVWVSHHDSDHSGGWPRLKKTLPVGEAFLPNNGGCYRGRKWQLGDLAIEALWPPQEHALKKPNNRSCTLLIEVAGVRVLLPGDIEASAERSLLAQGLPAVDVLFVPHHGSKTSSSQAFVDALRPRYIIVESGYANRYGHPLERVLARYDAYGATLFWTARDGAIRVRVSELGALEISSSRRERPSFWH